MGLDRRIEEASKLITYLALSQELGSFLYQQSSRLWAYLAVGSNNTGRPG